MWSYWPWPLSSDSQILVSASLSLSGHLKKLPQGVVEMTITRMGRTTRKHNAFSHGCYWTKGIKILSRRSLQSRVMYTIISGCIIFLKWSEEHFGSIPFKSRFTFKHNHSVFLCVQKLIHKQSDRWTAATVPLHPQSVYCKWMIVQLHSSVHRCLLEINPV